MDVLYLFHSGNEARLPFFDYDRPLWDLVFRSRAARWDSNSRSFIFPASAHEEWARLFENRVFVEVGRNIQIPLSVHNFFEGRRLFSPLAGTSVEAGTVRESFICEEDGQKLTQTLRARKYSVKTVKLYNAVLAGFCRHAQKTPARASLEDAQRYLAYLDERKAAASSMNVAISALKFFWREVLHSSMLDSITRPKGDKNLPAVLSQDEVRRILAAPKNLKHRLLLSLVYSAGLRVAEAVSLKHSDIDTDRRVIHIRGGKGRKDRYVMLSDKVCNLLYEYRLFFPFNLWLFPGSPASKHLSIRSAQHIFDRAVLDAAITKPVSIHSLRHAFATHLLERGTDIRYIQTFMGHTSIRTTERYAHVAHRKLFSIPSPLDTLED
jgi:site-specific recombinase XerD